MPKNLVSAGKLARTKMKSIIIRNMLRFYRHNCSNILRQQFSKMKDANRGPIHQDEEPRWRTKMENQDEEPRWRTQTECKIKEN